MNEQALRSFAEDAANRAAGKVLAETFRLFGVDLADQDSINEFRADLIHARTIRRLQERMQSGLLMALVTAAVLGGLALLWDGVKSHVGWQP